VELAFLNRSLLKKYTEKEMWDERGRDGEKKEKRVQNRLMPNPRSEEEKEIKILYFLTTSNKVPSFICSGRPAGFVTKIYGFIIKYLSNVFPFKHHIYILSHEIITVKIYFRLKLVK
jgi:hypothetical protein